jgi:hypothetical protein
MRRKTYGEVGNVEPHKDDGNPAGSSMGLPVMAAGQDNDTDDNLADTHACAAGQG